MKTITFVSRLIGFDRIKELQPYPAYKYAPKWFKQMPTDISEKRSLIPKLRTAKLCPSFHEIFQEGFILPAPCDIWLSYKDDQWAWKVSNQNIAIEIHDNDQMVKYLPKEAGIKQVFKLLYPYEIIVPKGYSIRQIPMAYDFNKDWYVGYGQFDGDKLPEVAIQIFYISDQEEILIEAGTPLCYYVPFKREKFKIVIGSFKKFESWIAETQHRAFTSFKRSYRRWI
tara:strand:- start:3426 stop:4103 length:678 start_codon:yes stop_codon:yes gene_type:complete